jgi:PA domain/Sortilin, neurotensin receptor 3,
VRLAPQPAEEVVEVKRIAPLAASVAAAVVATGLFASFQATSSGHVVRPTAERPTAERSTAERSTAKRPAADRDDEPRPDSPGEAAAYWAGLHQTPDGENPIRLNYQAKLAIDRERADRAPGSAPVVPNFAIAEWGPGNFGGRLRGIVVKADDADQLLVGSVSGGVWKTTDGGVTWTPVDDFLDSLAVGSMLADPDDDNRVFLGSGEGFFNVDAAQGVGIFESDDFGDAWNLLPATDNDDFAYVNRLGRIPGTNVLLAATGTGIWRSPDLGASWSEVSGATVTGRGFVDLKVDPSDPTRAFAYLFGASAGLLPIVTVNSPGGIAGDYIAASAQFGGAVPSPPGLTHDLQLVNDGTAFPNEGCSPLIGFTANRIAVIDRGSCAFTIKVKNAQDAGASAAIVVNNVAGAPFSMGGTDATITIPAVMVSQADGALIKGQLPSPGVNATLKLGTQLGSALFRSTNSGASWTLLDNANGLPTSDVSRAEIGIGGDGVIYLAVSNAAFATRGLWRSTDHGTSFTQTASATAFVERQGWYDMTNAVDPSNSNKVYLGAVDMYATTDAGATITKRTFWNPGAGQVPQFVHADHHVITFHPTDPDTFWIGCDGGIFKTTDGGNTFESLNNDLRVAQYYGIAARPDGGRVIGGTQDNGSHLFFGDNAVWLAWFGGDGGFAAWDRQQTAFVYGSLPNGGLFGSGDGGLTSTQIALPDTTGAAFIEPFTLDPNNGNRMIVGTDNVFYSANVRSLAGATWSSASAALGTLSATTISPINGAVAYAGNTGGQIFKSTGLGTAGPFNLIATPVPGADVTWIEVDPNAGNILYATFADYGPNRIQKSTNGGTTWTSISGNLPDIPLFAVRVDPTDPHRLFLGSELGLWTTASNDGVTPGGSFDWQQYDYGTAFTRVVQLQWTGSDTLWVGTHGRSIYRAQRDPVAVSVGDLVDSGCDGDGYLDSGETGTIPIAVTNEGGRDLAAVTVTLTTTHPQLMVVSGPIGYGTIVPGDTVTHDFTVSLPTLGGACLDPATLTATVDHADGSSAHDFQLTLGANPDHPTGTFTENAESPGTTLFTHEARLDTDDWATTTAQAHSGARSWFAADIGNFADKSLISPWLEVQGGSTQLSFALRYSLEGDVTQHWDGAVLELRAEGGDWTDVGLLSTVPYDGQLFTNNSAPARLAWSGTQTTWRVANVDLGGAYNGQRVQFRFRVICDENTANPGGGLWLDDIAITNVRWLAGLACDDSVVCSFIFADGFESGNTSAWSSAFP